MDYSERRHQRVSQKISEFEGCLESLISEKPPLSSDPVLLKMYQEKQNEYKELLKEHRIRIGATDEMEDSDEDEYDGCEEKENLGRQSSRDRLRKLMPVFSVDGEDVCVRSLRRAEDIGEGDMSQRRGPRGRLSEARSRRLAHLAEVINNWEDESDKKLPVTTKPTEKTHKPALKPISSPAMNKRLENFGTARSSSPAKKQVGWDEKIIRSLENQGFTRCESEQHLIYDYKQPALSPAKCSSSPSGHQSRAKAVELMKDTLPVRRSGSPVKTWTPVAAPPSPVKTVTPANRPPSPIKHFTQRDTSPVKPSSLDLSPVAFVKQRAPSPIKNIIQRDASPVKTFPVRVSPNKTTMDSSPVKRGYSPMKVDHCPVQPLDFTPMRSRTPSPVKCPSPVKNSAVLEMAAMYEKDALKSPEKKVKDPVELSIHDRKAIFERNAAAPLLPKAPFGMPVPCKVLQQTAYVSTTPVRREPQVRSETVKDNVSQAIIDREKELALLRNRWERKKEECGIQGGPKAVMPPIQQTPPPPPPPMPPSPNRIAMGSRSPVLSHRTPNSSPTRYGSVKKIRVSPPKPGRLYPSISDIETESEVPESDPEFNNTTFSDSDMSFGREVVRRSRTDLKRPIRATSSPTSTTDQESRILHEMDDFLDEALAENPSPPKRSKESTSQLSSSFEYTSTDTEAPLPPTSKITLVHTVSMYRKEQNEPEPPKTPLVHTVSMYRQKKEAEKSMMRNLEKQAEKELEEEIPESILVQTRIAELEIEMIKQTTIISQASQALNLCHSRPEFSGSAEEVEAEKLLLLSTSRRMAALHEIERLKVEKTLKPGRNLNNKDKGDVTIEYLSLPLKSKSGAIDHENIDHILCIVSSGPIVQATPVLSATKQNTGRGNRLVFTKPITLENLFCDFTITIEVYRMTTKSPGSSSAPGSESSKKDDKKTLTKLRLTPQKKTPKSHRMPIESPGGPNSVRTSSFQMIGFVVFSLRELSRSKFTLNKVPYGAPLEGTLELKMSTALRAEVEHRGFLTQFEEVSGFGAWKRKWALLRGSTIAFWNYPEHEEDRKVPIDTIDLAECSTKEVKLVSRDICARPNTFQLEMESGSRYLLSADTLDDRLNWCKSINKSLDLIRAWGGGRR